MARGAYIQASKEAEIEAKKLTVKQYVEEVLPYCPNGHVQAMVIANMLRDEGVPPYPFIVQGIVSGSSYRDYPGYSS